MKLTADMKVVGQKKAEKKRDEKKPLHSGGDTALRIVKPYAERGQFNI